MKARTMYRHGWRRMLGVLAVACAVIAVPLAARAGKAYGGGSRERAHGYLGIEFHDTTEDEMTSLHLQGRRPEVGMVDHDGPAGQAGLQVHDIVLQLDGQNIDNSNDLSKQIRESAPGRVILLSILRLGHLLNVKATLANREEVERKAYHDHLSMPSPPPPDDGVDNILVERYTIVETPPAAHGPSRGQSFLDTMLRTAPYTGASLDTMPPQLASYFGAPPKTGLLVQEVNADSPAAMAGLRAGDVVMKMDSDAVKSTSDWAKHLRAAKGRTVSLTVLRDRHEQTLTLTPDAKKHSLLQRPPLPFGLPPTIC